MSDTNRFIPEHRRHQHKGKNQFRGDELRRRREDQQVEIRKQKKEENLAKRRNLETKAIEWDGISGDTSESDDDNGLLNRKVSPRLRIDINAKIVSFARAEKYRSWRSSPKWSLACSPIMSKTSLWRPRSLEKSCLKSEIHLLKKLLNVVLSRVLWSFSAQIPTPYK